jgi:hypothetical protein
MSKRKRVSKDIDGLMEYDEDTSFESDIYVEEFSKEFRKKRGYL